MQCDKQRVKGWRDPIECTFKINQKINHWANKNYAQDFKCAQYKLENKLEGKSKMKLEIK